MIHDKFDPAHEMNLHLKLDAVWAVRSSPATTLRFKVLPQEGAQRGESHSPPGWSSDLPFIMTWRIGSTSEEFAEEP